MLYYFQLQFKILNRRIIDFGFPLLIGYALMFFAFILLSNYLFEKTEYAIYVYGLIALSFVSKLNETKRNNSLKEIFSKGQYRKLRIIENVVYNFPFTLFLVYENQLFFSFILNLFVVLITVLNFGININISISTPFGKKPFEFAVGFRKTFYVFPISYYLTYISVSVDNFNLGIFSMLLIGIICFSYYFKVEDKYFVWNYNLSSKEFLVEKIKIGILNFSILSSPIIVVMSIFFFNQIEILITFIFLCYTYLIVIICAKYSCFPSEMSVKEMILITMSVMFPPILLLFIPYFYFQSIKKLNVALND